MENKLIIDYKTAYPYGLNDRVNNISVTSIKDKLCIYQAFFKNNSLSLPKTNRVRSKNRNNRYIDMNILLNDICNNAFNKSNIVRYVKGKILGLSRTKVNILIKFLKSFDFDDTHVRDLLIDLAKFKTNKLNIDEDPTYFDSYLVVDFSHKYIDLINIPNLIQDQRLKEAFPCKETYPKISFRYSQTLGSISFNYAKFSKNINTLDIEEYPCFCENSNFKDNNYNHIVTGNLEILEDPEMIDIFKYGSKFRLTPRLEIDNIKNEIRNSVNEYIEKLSYKLHVHSGFFQNGGPIFLA